MIASRKRTLTAGVAAVLLSTFLLGAGFGPRAGREHGRRGRHHPTPNEMAIAVKFLDLTEDQKAAWREILQAKHQAAQPFVEEIVALEAELKDLLSDPDPDAAEVGALVIELSSLREEVRAIRADASAELLATLDDDQLDIVDAVAAAAPYAIAVPAFRDLGLI